MEKNMRKTRRLNIVHLPSSRKGTFGWTETQVHANVVARQLHRMSKTARPLLLSEGSLRGRIEESNVEDDSDG